MRSFLVIFVFSLLAVSALAQTNGPSNVSTCRERCLEAGLTTSKCKWICDGTPNADDADGGNEAIAVSCYDKCRDDGTSHTYCSSTCKTKGLPQVKKSCYERCRKGGSSHSHCEFTCR